MGEYTQFAKDVGKTRFEIVSTLLSSSAYQNSIDSVRAKMIEDAYSYATAVGAESVAGKKPDGWIEKAISIGVRPAYYIIFRNSSDMDGSGTTSQAEAARTLMNISGLTDLQRGKIWGVQNSQWSEDKNPFSGRLSDAGIAPDLATDIMETYTDIDNAAYSGSGIPRQKQTAWERYVDSLHITAYQILGNVPG